MNKTRASVLIAAIAAATFLFQSPAFAATSGSDAVVTTPSGPVRGVVNGPVREFLGIPYAAPPLNELRWKAPKPHPRWTATLDASKPGNQCAQMNVMRPGFSGSEDCLFLNVYTPNPPAKSMPVMVWIHGGTFLVGSGNTYDGSKLAEKGKLVVVTINYRLGPFGFLAHKSLDAEDPEHMSGNYGILDQQAALRWVKDNISAFGGDPKNVTVAGESAGGISIGMQLASPSAAGLFEHAIIESGPSLTTRPLKEAETRGDEFASKLGCDKDANPAKCMRSKNTEQVLAAIPASPLGGGLVWSPVMDGHVIPRQPAEAFATGQFNKVPLINGSNHDEGTLFVAFAEPQTPQQFEQAARKRLGKSADRVLAAYPLKDYPTPTQAAAAMLGDSFFSCGARKASELIAAQGVPVYEYEFDDSHAPNFPMLMPPFPLGAYHGSEIRYVFGTTMMRGTAELTPAQKKLSDEMMGYWIGFITSGHPGAASPEWKPYTKSADDILSLAPDKIGYTPDYAKYHHCDVWDSIGR